MVRTRSKTSDFGVSKREGHDSSKFYASRLYEGKKINDKQEIIDNSSFLDDDLFNMTLSWSKETISRIPDMSIHLIIYQVPKHDGNSKYTLVEFIDKHIATLSLLKEKLIIGGRLVVILDDEVPPSISGSCYWPFHAHLALEMINKGLYMRGEVILRKQLGPIEKGMKKNRLVNAYYHGLIFSNKVSRRIRKDKKGTFEKTDTITRDQFLEYTKSVWTVNKELVDEKIDPESSDIETLDYISRFIHLYSFKEDVLMIASPDIDDTLGSIYKSIRESCILIRIEQVNF
ncbi:MAG: hypothetical protein ACTSVI_12230 [Promethearchaeota archaeon]